MPNDFFLLPSSNYKRTQIDYADRPKKRLCDLKKISFLSNFVKDKKNGETLCTFSMPSSNWIFEKNLIESFPLQEIEMTVAEIDKERHQEMSANSPCDAYPNVSLNITSPSDVFHILPNYEDYFDFIYLDFECSCNPTIISSLIYAFNAYSKHKHCLKSRSLLSFSFAWPMFIGNSKSDNPLCFLNRSIDVVKSYVSGFANITSQKQKLFDTLLEQHLDEFDYMCADHISTQKQKKAAQLILEASVLYPMIILDCIAIKNRQRCNLMQFETYKDSCKMITWTCEFVPNFTNEI